MHTHTRIAVLRNHCLFSPVWRDINLELTMKEKDALLGRLVVGRSEEKQLENLETRIRTKPKSSDIF